MNPELATIHRVRALFCEADKLRRWQKDLTIWQAWSHPIMTARKQARYREIISELMNFWWVHGNRLLLLAEQGLGNSNG